jgi:hypothetical protein
VEPGDWNDADAAVYGGIEPLGVAVAEVVSISPTRRAYRLKAMNGEKGVLTFERVGDAGADASPLTLRCSMGHLGHPDLERQIVDSVTRRLEQLRGREFAPRR